MASLETVVFPQDPFGYCSGRELYGQLGHGGGGENSGFLDDLELGKLEQFNFDNLLDSQVGFEGYSGGTMLGVSPTLGELSSCPYPNYSCSSSRVEAEAVVIGERPKRRRGRSRKNWEDIESQRMTHIAVERNRRKQMNEYLSVLRSLVPESYVQRGDQASIIGGAINFVKELEHQVHLLGARKQSEQLPFSDCFSLPQSSSFAAAVGSPENNPPVVEELQPQPSEVADIEVMMVESHASMKIRSKRRPKQLLRLVSDLQAHRLTVLHLNVSTADQVVLYSLSLKVEDDCKLTTVDDVSSAAYQILTRIQDEEACA